MSSQVHTGLNYSHPAIDRFVAALENIQALLHIGRTVVEKYLVGYAWPRLLEATERYNQKRVEAMIMRDPRISDEIRMALLRGGSRPD